ncbi:MAG: beta-N-acetylhexosaminidase [Myxococcota bacterium]
MSEVSRHCGQIIFGGFTGTELPTSFSAALSRGERGGAVLFRRNIGSWGQVAALNASVAAAGGLVAVDQEGGRVARLGAPVLSLPPMRTLGDLDRDALTRGVGEALGRQLKALGFHVDFAPVLDVDSNPDNPVIGDRSFGRTPAVVARHGIAFARGLQAGGVAACGKHFPGHGDTSVDSHLTLPTVERDADALDRLELWPFRCAVEKMPDLAAIMSAHVVFRAPNDETKPSRPATLAPRFATELLREHLGFEGVLFSDDLEMGALRHSLGLPVPESAVEAVRAGCDAVLICSDEAAQDAAFGALVRAAERASEYRGRVAEAAGRVARLKARFGGHVDASATEALEKRLESLGREVKAALERALADSA